MKTRLTQKQPTKHKRDARVEMESLEVVFFSFQIGDLEGDEHFLFWDLW